MSVYHRQTPYDDELLSVSCAHCGAEEGQRCTFPDGAPRKCPCLCRLRKRDGLREVGTA